MPGTWNGSCAGHTSLVEWGTEVIANVDVNNYVNFAPIPPDDGNGFVFDSGYLLYEADVIPTRVHWRIDETTNYLVRE